MDYEVSYEMHNEQDLWDELNAVVSRDCPTNVLIDEALRSYLDLAASFRRKYITSENDIARCSLTILEAPIFEKHEDYVRRQIIYCLLQDEDPGVLVFVTCFLLFDVRERESTAALLNEEGAFTRLVDLISGPQQLEDNISHRLLMELLYEISRIQQIKAADLMYIDDNFVCQLFELIEDFSNNANDPYHYPIIRVLLVLNEQFMVSAHDPSVSSEFKVLTNRVIKVLASKGGQYKTFGENIILLLNRESETSLQLLTLKLLYLLFTTPPTQEYFYTNDLRVLVDILLRNLLDLPSDAAALRHTYLRVLYPLLAHTQLRLSPPYKREEIRKVLTILVGAQYVKMDDGDNTSNGIWSHFEEADLTTKRLVQRCRTVPWLEDPNLSGPDNATASEVGPLISPVNVVSEKKVPPAPPDPRKLQKRNVSQAEAGFLVPQHQTANGSTLSVLEVVAQREKPGVMTPSRRLSLRGAATRKEKPLPPRARRSAWSRRETEADRQIGGCSSGDIDASATAGELTPKARSEKVPPVTKKPPAAPIPCRRRGKWTQQEEEEEDEGYDVSSRADLRESLPPRLSLESRAPYSEKAPIGASVAEALSTAQAQAVDGMNEVWQRASEMPSSNGINTILAPPSSAPPRSVPGPTFSLEKSPFLGDNEED